MFRAYNIIFLTAAIAATLLYVGAYNLYSWRWGDIQKIPFRELYDYQLGKAENEEPEILFVGDSSLGNSLDAAYFSELSGQDTVNLSLTGKFGFLGTLRMMERADKSRLKSIVIMQTADIFTREPAPDYKPPRKILGIDVGIINYSSFKLFLLTLTKKPVRTSSRTFAIENDFIKQGDPLPANQLFTSLNKKNIHNDKKDILAEIVNYCAELNLRCIYMHGPLVMDICTTSDDYFAAINGIITASSLPLALEKPLCIPRNKLGDSSDHVQPAYKKEYTEKIYVALKPYL